MVEKFLEAKVEKKNQEYIVTLFGDHRKRRYGSKNV